MKKKKKRTNKWSKWLFDVAFFLVIIVMLSGAFVFFISNKADKSFFGYRFYEVLTNSMKKTEPGQKGNFVAGDMIIVKIEEPDKVKVGDIITFVPNSEAKDTYLTHRVKRIEEGTIEKAENDKEDKRKPSSKVFVTQGDANNTEDPPTAAKNVIGTVKFAIPNAGNVINMIRKSPVLVATSIISMLLLMTLLRGYFVDSKEVKKQETLVNKSGKKKKSRKKSSHKKSEASTSKKQATRKRKHHSSKK